MPLTGLVDPSLLKAAGAGMPVLALSAPLGDHVAVPFFSLAAPRIELATTDVPDAGLVAWLAFATTLSADDGTPLCAFTAFVGADATEVTFVLSPFDSQPGPALRPDTMARLVHVDYGSGIPGALKAPFNTVTLQGLAATIALGDSLELTGIDASIGSSAPASYGQFTLTELSLELTAMAPVGSGPVLIRFEAKARMFPDVIEADFDVVATYDTASGDLTVGAGFTGDIKLSQVVRGLAGKTVTLPDDLELTFSNFGVMLSEPSADGQAAYTFYGAAEAGITLPFLGAHIDGDLRVLVDSAARSYQLTGVLLIGASVFGVAADLTATQKTVSGRWEALSPPYLGIDQLAAAAGQPAPPIPPELDLNLKSAELVYDVTAKVLAVTAESVTYGQAAFAAGRDASGHWGFVFGVLPEVAVTLDLTTIDVIGKLVPGGDDIISLSNLRIAGASAALPAVVPPDAAAIIGPVVNSGLMLGAELKAGTAIDQTLTVRFGGTAAPPAGTASSPAVVAGPQAGASPAPPTLWINVQRSFGPVHFERVGFTVTSQAELALLLDAAVSVAGLTVGLTGLQASMPIRAPYVPSFDLAGLQVQFSGGGVAIGGGLEKVPGSAPAEYTGELTVQLPRFGVTMFGSYTSYTTVNEQPSLFAFLFLDAPLGGPAFFFVTGLAGGFGYNRSLQLPDISGVATYPLVAGASPPHWSPTACSKLVFSS